MSDERTKISKLLALGLRHKPEELGMTLDEHGWAKTSDVIAGVKARGYRLTPAILAEIVAADDKQRYSFHPSGNFIRANQGHSVASVDLELSPQTPPGALFHGTSQKSVGDIMASGLQRMARQYVHLSTSVETATTVGNRRRGETVIFRIDAARAHADGVLFYVSENGVWLVKDLPAQYLEILYD